MALKLGDSGITQQGVDDGLAEAAIEECSER
jgi:hypothetical protein